MLQERATIFVCQGDSFKFKYKSTLRRSLRVRVKATLLL